MMEYRKAIYGSTRNLSGSDIGVLKMLSDLPSGRYWPKTGQW